MGEEGKVDAGILAGDEESYTEFADIFDPIISELHSEYAKVYIAASICDLELLLW